MASMNRAYIGIGSNVNRVAHLRMGILALRTRFGELVLSTVYESPAWGFTGDPFYNMVAGLETSLSAPGLVRELRQIEDRCGRRRQVARFSSRTLDLDLLLYDDLICMEPELVLPHPDVLSRAFVLGPLAEVAGASRHPQDGRTFAELWCLCSEQQTIRQVPRLYDEDQA